MLSNLHRYKCFFLELVSVHNKQKVRKGRRLEKNLRRFSFFAVVYIIRSNFILPVPEPTTSKCVFSILFLILRYNELVVSLSTAVCAERMYVAHFMYLQWEKQLINHPADSWSIDRKRVRGLFYNPVLYLCTLGHANLPHLLMIDGTILQSRMGNPSLMAAFIFFSQSWFSSS